MRALVEPTLLIALVFCVFCCVLSTLSDELEHTYCDAIPIAACLLQSKRVLAKSSQSHPAIPQQLLMTGRFASVDDLPTEVMKNLQYTLSNSPGLTFRYFNDTHCRVYVKDHFGDDFAKIYDSEPHGSFRGDICRTAFLLREGGFYMDLDFQLHVPLHTLVDEHTTMMTVISGTQGPPVILNALIAVRPSSSIMHETLARIKKWYDGPRQGLLGPLAMARALSEMMHQQCPQASLSSAAKPTQWPCGSENLRFYQEEGLGSGVDCLSAGEVVCPRERAVSSFNGAQFGIFSGGTASKEARLIGWPRFAACTKLGCGINGGEVSLLAQSIEIKETKRAAQSSKVQ